MFRDDAVNLMGNALTNQGMDVRFSRLKRTREMRCSKKVFHGDWVMELSSRPVTGAFFYFLARSAIPRLFSASRISGTFHVMLALLLGAMA